MFFLSKLLLFALLSLSIFAEVEFKPHMLDHAYAGCPANSQCSKEVGKLRLRWLKILSYARAQKNKVKVSLLEKHRKEYGIPITFWSLSEKKAEPQVILWDSHCKQHSSEGKQKILLAEAYVKNFRELKNLAGSLSKKVYLAKEDKIVSYQVPRQDAPLSLAGEKLYYTREEDGFYYGLYIGPNGSMKVTSINFPKRPPVEVSCPKNLVRKFQQELPYKNLYSGHFCKSLWNTKTGRRQTLLLGWSCN